MSETKLTCGSLFAGIGGFDLGFERAGIKTVWQVEIDEYCRKVLARHFPDAKRYTDVRDVHGQQSPTKCANCLEPVDVIVGGFPCQDISDAGRRAGIDGERSGLWSHYFRLIGELRPRFAVVENVSALLGRGIERVLGDLASIGYDAEWDCISAQDAGAPHLRQRVWIVAYPMRDRHLGTSTANAAAYYEERNASPHREIGTAITSSAKPGGEDVANPLCAGFQERNEQRSPATQRSPIISRGEFVRAGAASGRDEWEIEPNVGRVANGVPHRVDRLKALGNSIVPQIAEWIGSRIVAAEGRMSNF